MRRDRFGNTIKTGSKQHKLTFRDQVVKGETIQEIYEVECWKKYNALDGNGDDESTFKCKCSIF